MISNRCRLIWESRLWTSSMILLNSRSICSISNQNVFYINHLRWSQYYQLDNVWINGCCLRFLKVIVVGGGVVGGGVVVVVGVVIVVVVWIERERERIRIIWERVG